MPDSEITNEVESQQNRLLLRLAYTASGTAGVLVISIAAWVVNECLESKQFRVTTESRINSLESGRTIPMAAETRAELNAIWRQIGSKPE